MKYEEFNKKYNKRDSRGVILECSIINLNGDIIFHDTLNKVEDYWDNNIEVIWNDKKSINTINGQEVVMTNVGKFGGYSDHFFKKLHFNVERN